MTEMTETTELTKTQAKKVLLPELQAKFPQAFPEGKKIPVLAIGIHEALMAHGYPEHLIRAFLGNYCKRVLYQYAVLRETHRVDLEGNPVGEITEEHKGVAKENLKVYKKTKKARAAAKALAKKLQEEAQARKAQKLKEKAEAAAAKAAAKAAAQAAQAAAIAAKQARLEKAKQQGSAPPVVQKARPKFQAPPPSASSPSTSPTPPVESPPKSDAPVNTNSGRPVLVLKKKPRRTEEP